MMKCYNCTDKWTRAKEFKLSYLPEVSRDGENEAKITDFDQWGFGILICTFLFHTHIAIAVKCVHYV